MDEELCPTPNMMLTCHVSFHGYTQEQYATDFIMTMVNKSIDPRRVWSQSFNCQSVQPPRGD